MSLQLVPMTLADANAVVVAIHRHSPPVTGSRFSVGAAVDERIVGAAIAGRPVARALDDGWTIEVLRVATDGTYNACSFLYGACWRAARGMGYVRATTYTLSAETGASLRAAGWECVAELPARPEGWKGHARPGSNYLASDRYRWQKGSSPDIAPPEYQSVAQSDQEVLDLGAAA